MAKNMAEKQYDAAYKAGGEFIEDSLFIYYTSTDQWTRLTNMSDDISTETFKQFYASKGFEICDDSSISFLVRKTSLIKA
jgi:hypothetical protein